MVILAQDKQKEVAFFDGHAATDAYDVFTPETNACLDHDLRPARRIQDGNEGYMTLGCGLGGVHRFAAQWAGLRCGRSSTSARKLIGWHAKNIPMSNSSRVMLSTCRFRTAASDGILLSRIGASIRRIPLGCASEVFRCSNLAVLLSPSIRTA